MQRKNFFLHEMSQRERAKEQQTRIVSEKQTYARVKGKLPWQQLSLSFVVFLLLSALPMLCWVFCTTLKIILLSSGFSLPQQ
jgi:hypothetical protein